MKLNFLTFFIKDIDKTIEFYEELAGLKVERRFNPGIGEIIFMGNGGDDTKLEFIKPTVPGLGYKQGSGMTMCFYCDGDLEELRVKTVAIGYNPSDINDKGPEPTNFKVLDPNGILVEFCK